MTKRFKKLRRTRIIRPTITNHYLGIKPYNRFSKSAREIRRFLNLARYNELHKYKVLVNWGCKRKDFNADVVLNKEENIKNASNKLLAFRLFSEAGLRVPRTTTNIEEARTFRFPVFCRINGLNKGRGIRIAHNETQLVNSDFYSEYIPCKEEFRVHVFRDEILSWSKKINKSYGNKYIRNHDNGYKFSLLDNDRIYSNLSKYAISAVKSLGLDFGGVDVLWGDDNKFYVLEVNTASGIEGSVLERYARKFKKVAKDEL